MTTTQPTSTPTRQRSRRSTRAVVLAVAVSAVAATGTVYATTSGNDIVDTGPTTVGVADTGAVGEILVDGQGRTLYLFAADEPDTVTCTGGCADKWPPLTMTGTTAPDLGGGVREELIGSAPDENGAQVVTYAGWPLYRYDSDDLGEASGHGVDENGGEWFAVTVTGERAK